MRRLARWVFILATALSLVALVVVVRLWAGKTYRYQIRWAAAGERCWQIDMFEGEGNSLRDEIGLGDGIGLTAAKGWATTEPWHFAEHSGRVVYPREATPGGFNAEAGANPTPFWFPGTVRR